jgi:hypothetical protein
MKLDPKMIALNAAGITDAFRLLQAADPDGSSRIEQLARDYGHWRTVLERIVQAAEVMERVRAQSGNNAQWGRELPSIDDVWWAIAEALWHEMEQPNLARLVRSAIAEAHAGVDEPE